MFQIHNDDNQSVLKTIPSSSVDCVITDPPYNKIASKWDTAIDLEWMWNEFARITTPKAQFIFTSSQPFTSRLVMSRVEWYKHEWIWEKPNGQGQVKYGPNRVHENIVVFARSSIQYTPQMTQGKPYTWNSVRTKSKDYPNWQQDKVIENTGTRYPRSVQKFKQQRGLHPTQKPVELFEMLVRTYTKPNQMVLDPYMGSGTTGVACVRTGRNFIGVELDADYYATANTRLTQQHQQDDI
jgi:site-specific DNA-methyltransferase (adenine-specific)